MKSLIFPSLFVLLMSLNAFSQNAETPGSFRFIWTEANYLFYDTYDLTSVAFQYGIPDAAILKAAKTVAAIDRVELSNGNGVMFFKSNPQPSDIRKFAEKAGLTELYVNDILVLPAYFINPSDIQKLKEKTPPAATAFQKEFNEPGTRENIEFNIHYYQSKLYSMQISNYPRYLYSGTITEYNIKLNEYQMKLNQLTTKN